MTASDILAFAVGGALALTRTTRRGALGEPPRGPVPDHYHDAKVLIDWANRAIDVQDYAEARRLLWRAREKLRAFGKLGAAAGPHAVAMKNALVTRFYAAVERMPGQTID